MAAETSVAVQELALPVIVAIAKDLLTVALVFVDAAAPVVVAMPALTGLDVGTKAREPMPHPRLASAFEGSVGSMTTVKGRKKFLRRENSHV